MSNTEEQAEFLQTQIEQPLGIEINKDTFDTAKKITFSNSMVSERSGKMIPLVFVISVNLVMLLELDQGEAAKVGFQHSYFFFV